MVVILLEGPCSNTNCNYLDEASPVPIPSIKLDERVTAHESRILPDTGDFDSLQI
jgi:hypothetical protein